MPQQFDDGQSLKFAYSRRAVMIGSAAAAGALALGAAAFAAPVKNPVVATKQGRVRGAMENGVAVFRGIPYAQAPVGKLRFKPPAQVPAWSGVRDALKFGLSHPQLTVEGVGSEVGLQGDDCLNLNIWTPEIGSAKLPVMVWIHGGALIQGSGSEDGYNGAAFAASGVATVTINYRLGYAGFLHIGDRPGSAAFGILDQIAALRWVQENIAAFGGDPGAVTIAGESSGSNCIGALLGAPAARGLYRRAILQSGTVPAQVRRETAAIVGAEVLRRLRVRADDEDGLAKLTTAQLITAQPAVGADTMKLLKAKSVAPDFLTTVWGHTDFLVYDNETLPRSGVAAIDAGAARGIDVLLGTNADEYTFFPSLLPGISDLAVKNVGPLAELALGQGRGAAALGVYRRNRPGASDLDVTCAFMTDLLFFHPMRRTAEAAYKQGSRVYMYRFALSSPPSGGALGATHGTELPFMWNALHRQWPLLKGKAPANPPQSLATAMHGAWAEFVKTGSPQHRDLPRWPAYDLKQRSTMVFDTASRVVNDPRADERRVWASAEHWPL